MYILLRLLQFQYTNTDITVCQGNVVVLHHWNTASRRYIYLTFLVLEFVNTRLFFIIPAIVSWHISVQMYTYILCFAKYMSVCIPVILWIYLCVCDWVCICVPLVFNGVCLPWYLYFAENSNNSLTSFSIYSTVQFGDTSRCFMFILQYIYQLLW